MVSAFDAVGNEENIENAFKINIDQRPVIDIVAPTLGSRVVEGANVAVNIHASDDVAIDHVRAIVKHKGHVLETRRFVQGPYTFVFEAPELTNNIQDNQVEIEVEAIDTYGVKFNDLDRHTAKEKLTLAIKGDEAPVV